MPDRRAVSCLKADRLSLASGRARRSGCMAIPVAAPKKPSKLTARGLFPWGGREGAALQIHSVMCGGFGHSPPVRGPIRRQRGLFPRLRALAALLPACVAGAFRPSCPTDLPVQSVWPTFCTPAAERPRNRPCPPPAPAAASASAHRCPSRQAPGYGRCFPPRSSPAGGEPKP